MSALVWASAGFVAGLNLGVHIALHWTTRKGGLR